MRLSGSLPALLLALPVCNLRAAAGAACSAGPRIVARNIVSPDGPKTVDLRLFDESTGEWEVAVPGSQMTPTGSVDGAYLCRVDKGFLALDLGLPPPQLRAGACPIFSPIFINSLLLRTARQARQVKPTGWARLQCWSRVATKPTPAWACLPRAASSRGEWRHANPGLLVVVCAPSR